MKKGWLYIGIQLDGRVKIAWANGSRMILAANSLAGSKQLWPADNHN